MGRVVHGASCLWGELSMGRVVVGRVVRGASGPGTFHPLGCAINDRENVVAAITVL